MTHTPARWFVREAGTLVEVKRITRPHRTRSLVLVADAARPARTWYAEARTLIRS